jgi:2-oxoglutarate ferredoxin oxidoreductase subunit alpha
MSNTNNRLVIKIGGAAGQGIKTAGLIIAKSFKRLGYMAFGYTEYPSLIRGGDNVYQIEIYDKPSSSVSSETDILIALNQAAVNLHFKELTMNGAIIYDGNSVSISPEIQTYLNKNKIGLYPVKLMDEVKNAGGNILMKNIVSLGSLWRVLNMDLEHIKPLIEETYHKTQEMIDLNFKCLQAGFDAIKNPVEFSINLTPKNKFKDNIFITGNEAIALGAIAGGVRLFVSYPMTPASSILTYLAKEGPTYGMIVKQAEDEITSAIMTIGAAHAGTRAMCGTSGGGFDLMTESLSLAGMTETPFVCVLAQRPGPATGAPTWTGQGDLNLAVFSGHGEFPRIVLAISDPEDAFYFTNEALNLSEKFQTPVILLTDKYLAESSYSVAKFDMSKIEIIRGKIIKEAEGNDSSLRYELTGDGVSPRWFPGDNIATFLANSDEHTQKGYSTEDEQETQEMMDKRTLKENTIFKELPEPVILGSSNSEAELSIISWGSNKGVILDVIEQLASEGIKISYLHLTYIWPLKTETLAKFIQEAKNIVIIEGNRTAQLASLIKRQTGLEITNKLLKFNGRPFTYEELLAKIKALI